MAEIRNEKLDKPELKPITPKAVYKTIPFAEFQGMDIPKPTKIIGDIIYLGDLTILFGYNGRGKSIGAVQFGLSVALGCDLDLGNGVILENNHEPMNVIYFDYELKAVQIKDRLGTKEMPPNFYRSSLLRGESEGQNPNEIFERIKKEAEEFDCSFIIIDNMSKISSIDLSNGKEVKTFLEPLHKLCLYEGYTILIVGHTTLSADSFIPLEKKHLFGSSYIGNYADAITGIGKVNSDESEFYLKQLKTRVSAEKYGSNNVIRFSIISDQDGYTRFFSNGTCNEQELLIPVLSNTEKAPNRTFYTILSIYYGSSRNAEKKLAEVGIKAPHTTINYNANAFKAADSKLYKEMESWDKDRQKSFLESQSPDSDNCLPYADGHIPKSNDDNEIPF